MENPVFSGGQLPTETMRSYNLKKRVAGSSRMPILHMERPTVALVVAQIGITHTPELGLESVSLRRAMIDLGFPITEMRTQTNVTVNAVQQPLQVRSENTWLYFNPSKTTCAAISANSLWGITSAYEGFDAFRNRIMQFSDSLTKVIANIFVTSISLRYVNVLQVDNIPSDMVAGGLAGLTLDGLPSDHFHHKYELWCATLDGVLTVRCNSRHGSDTPIDLGLAATMYRPSGLVRSDTVYHIDISERASTVSAPLPLDPEQANS
ncbi:MAG: TIGR04255 family protein [Planctomycetota bacterium]|nr:TIGR04255 family protein [Planctomycetota bacterium]